MPCRQPQIVQEALVSRSSCGARRHARYICTQSGMSVQVWNHHIIHVSLQLYTISEPLLTVTPADDPRRMVVAGTAEFRVE